MIDEQEVALQRASDRLVKDGVIYCISSLINELMNKLPNLPDWENFYPTVTFDITYRCDECNRGWIEEEKDQSDYLSKCSQCGAEVAPYFFEEHYKEVFEHWIVDAWLADKLKEEGELIVENFMEGAIGYIWCRTTTGQSISMDYVIREITKKYYDI